MTAPCGSCTRPLIDPAVACAHSPPHTATLIAASEKKRVPIILLDPPITESELSADPQAANTRADSISPGKGCQGAGDEFWAEWPDWAMLNFCSMTRRRAPNRSILRDG